MGIVLLTTAKENTIAISEDLLQVFENKEILGHAITFLDNFSLKS